MIRHITLSFFVFLYSIGSAQNGKLLTKELVNLHNLPIWNEISENDTLKTAYVHLNELDFYFITYQSDHLEVKGILLEPKEAGKFPVVIFNRGGNREYSQLTIAAMIMYTSRLASQGYVIVASNYRQKDEFGGAEINDVLSLTETVKEIKKADTERLGMFGWSRGGMMTYLALKRSDKIKTAVVGNGPTDLFELISDRPKMETNVIAQCVPDYWKRKESELRKRSVVYWVDELNKHSSLLILCGTKDKRVNPNQAYKLAKELKDINYNFELNKFKTDHFFSDKKAELNNLVIKWFDKELKNRN